MAFLVTRGFWWTMTQDIKMPPVKRHRIKSAVWTCTKCTRGELTRLLSLSPNNQILCMMTIIHRLDYLPPNLLRAIAFITSLLITRRKAFHHASPTVNGSLWLEIKSSSSRYSDAGQNPLESTSHHFITAIALSTPTSVTFERSTDCKIYLDKRSTFFSLGAQCM